MNKNKESSLDSLFFVCSVKFSIIYYRIDVKIKFNGGIKVNEEYIYNAPTIVKLSTPTADERHYEHRGLEFSIVVWKVYLTHYINVELININESVRNNLLANYGEDVSKMEYPVVQLCGLIGGCTKLKGDTMSDKYDNYKSMNLTSEDVWETPLMINNFNETHDVTLQNLKDMNLAKFIHSSVMKYIVERNL